MKKEEDFQDRLKKIVDERTKKIIKSTKIPSIRPQLESVLLELVELEVAIQNTRDSNELRELSRIILEKAKRLEGKISHHKEMLQTKAKVEEAKRDKDFYEKKQKFLGQQKKARDRKIEEDPLRESFDASMRDYLRTMENNHTKIDKKREYIRLAKTQPLENKILWFNIRRIAFGIWRHLERFFVAVVVLGVILGSVISHSAKVFFAQNWILLFLPLLIWNVLKEYKIGPWLKDWRFKRQRKDLYIFLEAIVATEIQFLTREALED